MHADPAGNRSARLAALAIAAGATLVYVYAIYRIALAPEGDGTGMQWVAVVPLGFFWLIVCAAALYVARQNR